MNLRTTVVLLILAGAGVAIWMLAPTAVGWLVATPQAGAALSADSVKALKSELANELAPKKLTRIEVDQGTQKLVLERPSGGEWSLPGKWPTRQQAVDELVGVIAGVSSSRFAPLPLTDPAEFGLDHPAVTVVAWVGGTHHRLAFGEERAESNRFSRATFLRVDDRPEAIRLAPGLLAVLQRPQEHYQQRRLFVQIDRAAKDSFSQEKADRLNAQALAVKGPAGSFAVVKKGDEWDLTEPVHDHADPDKLKTILFAVPDIWAEQFVDKGKKDLADFGLKEPEQTLRVTGTGNGEVVLLIGKKSRTTTRTVMRPAPNLGGPPMPPQQEVVHEDYRYAKLAGNDQIFDIKADRLKDIFVEGKSLRDAQLARFRTDEARRVEIHPGNGSADIVAVKEKDRWRLQQPYASDAEESKITEVLDKLSGLQARDKEVIDAGDPKAYGFAGTTAIVKV